MIHPSNFQFDCTSSYQPTHSFLLRPEFFNSFFLSCLFHTFSNVPGGSPLPVMSSRFCLKYEPSSVTTASHVYAWLAVISLVCAFLLPRCFCFYVMSDVIASTCACFVCANPPVLHAYIYRPCFIGCHDIPLQIYFKLFLPPPHPPGLERVQVFQWTHSACPSLAWRHPWCRADPWLALVYLVGTSPPWAGPSYILPM